MLLSWVGISGKLCNVCKSIENDCHRASGSSQLLTQACSRKLAETSDMATGFQDDSKATTEFEYFHTALSYRRTTFKHLARTAIIARFPPGDLPSLLGSKVYVTGEHDIRVMLHTDGDPDGRGTMIGMINDINRKVGTLDCPKPGVKAWNSKYKSFVFANGCIRPNRDLGQPWRSGDIVHLHLDCEKHTLCARHERTGKIDTIENVVEPQRLYVGVTERGTKVRIFSK